MASRRAADKRTPAARPPRKPASLLPIYLALFLTTLAVYSSVRHFDFVNFDDPDYVTANPHVLRGITSGGLAWALTSGDAANWFPVTRISHMLDCQFFGLDAGRHHLVNVLIHALAAVALFAFLHRATRARWPSAFVAFLFALHPLHVESVAWVSERKDVLSTLFWFLTLWAWVRYTERPAAPRYALALALFALGLMSKPMVVTLPLVLVLLDLWPLQRGLAVREKIPFFALSAAGAIATFLVQRGSGAVQALASVPLGLRVENAAISCVIYIAKILWPSGLAVFYPYPPDWPLWQAAAAALAIAGVSVLAVRWFRTCPYLAAGWFWYLVTLAPVIGLVQVGAQARADRYTYLPMTGLAIALAWGAAEIVRHRRALAALAALACTVSAAVAWAQVQHWRNSETLFRHTLDVTENNYVAEHNLGQALTDIPGRLPDAIAHLKAAVRLQPDSARARTDLGTALAKLPDRIPEAVAEYQAALRTDPASPIPHRNLANVLAKIPGRLPEAIAEYETALRLDPDSAAVRIDLAGAHNDLATALMNVPGRLPEALAHYDAAQRLAPDSAEIQYNLGAALSGVEGRLPEAIAHLESALRLKPDYAEAHNNLGVVLSNVPGRQGEAIAHFEAALRLKPDYEDARYNLSLARGH